LQARRGLRRTSQRDICGKLEQIGAEYLGRFGGGHVVLAGRWRGLGVQARPAIVESLSAERGRALGHCGPAGGVPLTATHPPIYIAGTKKMIDPEVLHRLAATLAERKKAPADTSYVASLYAKGTDAICKKIAEEAAETIMAAKDGDRLHIVRETADVWFHTLVLLAQFDLGPDDVLAELHRREGISGIDEKRSRKE